MVRVVGQFVELHYQLSQEGQRALAFATGTVPRREQVAYLDAPSPGDDPLGLATQEYRRHYEGALSLARFEPDGRAVVRIEGEYDAVRDLLDLLADARHARLLRDLEDRERERWIADTGSAHLKRLVAEGIEHGRLYRNERLAAERPSWKWWDRPEADLLEARNPSPEAIRLLDAARAWDPRAELRFGTEPLAGGEVRTFYVAASSFLGRIAVYFGRRE